MKLLRLHSNGQIPERTRSHGFVLISVIVALVISVALFGLWARAAVREHRQLANQQLRMQATRLAEAGLGRAMAQRAANQEYADETWIVPATDLGGTQAAQVRIRVAPNADGSAFAVSAVAEYPTGEVRHAQVSKKIEIPSISRENPS